MALAPSTRLGPYEILAPLGAGGMGEVYRARDTRLGRDVAIKVLPPFFAADPERLRRFELEARTTGMLNHPNILAVYDIGTHEGSPYLVTELLEGETLRQALPVVRRKALDFAQQICQGLAAAHAKGVTHRDLKPENIFITTDGRVKILDFGLAKVNSDLDGTETAAAGATTPGAALGTAGYMSPEQARGKPADARSDLFSLGVILWEMFSGQRAFQRESAVEAMNAILKEDPPPLAEAGLERVVRRSIEKLPDQRFQSASDLAFALEALSGSMSQAPALPAQARPRARLVWTFLAIVAALALGLLAGRELFQRSLPKFKQLTFRRGFVLSSRLTPDARSVVYGASWDGAPIRTFLTRLEAQGSQPLSFPDADILAISSSGEMALSIGRHLQANGFPSGNLARAPLLGGAAREVLENVYYADWAPDGASLAVVRRMGDRTRLEFPAGKILYETGGGISFARISPQGDRIAFFDHPLFGDDRGFLAIVDLSGKKTILSPEYGTCQGLAWHPSSGEIWYTVGGSSDSGYLLQAVNLSGKTRTLLQLPMRIRLDDISRDGRMLLAMADERFSIQGLAPGETLERDLSWQDLSSVSDISADGQTILFNEFGESQDYSVYLRKTDGSAAVRIGLGGTPNLSVDGKWAVSVLPSPPQQLLLMPTGAGEPRRLSREGLESYQQVDWFPDGKRILVWASEPGQRLRLFEVELESGKRRAIAPEGVQPVPHPVSPDGAWVLGRAAERGLAMYPVAGGDPRPVTGVDPDETPVRWGEDGKSIFVCRSNRLPATLSRLDLATGKKTLWKELLPPDKAGVQFINSVQAAASGKAYAYTYKRVVGQLYLVDSVK